jgi:3',5'-cyclic AMP phosphodiesterase CpdA
MRRSPGEDGPIVTAFTLAHLSDPHLAPLPRARLSELLSKRGLGYLNWLRNRRKRHSRAVVDALAADVRAQSPDHIAVTGDLVNLSLPDEFLAARDWLATLGGPDDVSVVPGNHDAYVAAMRMRFPEILADYMRGDAAAPGAAPFPYLRRRGPLALIGASTSVPTGPLMATGQLGASQIEALDALLGSPALTDAFRVLLIHHPLRSRNRYKRMIDADALLAVLKRRRVDLILHGHDHKHSLMWFDGIAGQIPAIGVPSASNVIDGKHDPAAYNIFRIARDADNNWRCDWTVRGFQEGRDGISELRRQTLI